jgi:MioC protein
MEDFLIIVGTESGNAQMVAEILQEELAKTGRHADVLSDGGAAEARLDERAVALVCCSTHGDGELPENIRKLHAELSVSRPDLSRLRYGVIALGDRTYAETFCRGGKTMDAFLASLGAKRVGERLEIDAFSQPLPDEEALAWTREWLALL